VGALDGLIDEQHIRTNEVHTQQMQRSCALVPHHRLPRPPVGL
jgi:hypothetical protein